MASHLTARKVETAKPGKYGDGANLYLVVSKTGAKKWVLRFIFRGKSKEMGLGSATSVALADAREKAASARRKIAQRFCLEFCRSQLCLPQLKLLRTIRAQRIPGQRQLYQQHQIGDRQHCHRRDVQVQQIESAGAGQFHGVVCPGAGLCARTAW